MLQTKNVPFMIGLLLLLCLNPTVWAQSKFERVKMRAGGLPVDCTKSKRPCRSIFDLPEAKQPTLKLLGTQNFKRMLYRFSGVEAPIDIVSGYIVLDGMAKYEPLGQVIVLMELKTGNIYVGFFDMDANYRRSGSPEWYSTRGKYEDLLCYIRDEVDRRTNQ